MKTKLENESISKKLIAVIYSSIEFCIIDPQKTWLKIFVKIKAFLKRKSVTYTKYIKTTRFGFILIDWSSI